ncbi:MAG: regulatory iron-sulfur-containing complex subunit RicT [bacterium]
MPEELPRVTGVRFRNAGKIFYFHTAGMRLETGEYVVVETIRGPEIAKVVIAPDQVVVNELGREELKPILRIANESDLRKADALKKEAEELLPEARRLGEELRFPAHIDGAEFTLDGRRLTFSFTSDERLDYRDFIKRAGDRFHARVDMRQMGARDRAKLAGGYGICGRELCCSSWLTTFPSISIRMAKEQELPLNPQKISGLCGRLLCCLSYEEEGYKEMRKSLPKIGQRCSTPTGEGKVININILRRTITLWSDGQRIDVPDRDLGTVVRWDVTSKIGDPPPSISRADAIAQGLIEATEDDLVAAARLESGPDWLDERPILDPGPGRGRLPGGGPRKNMPARPPRQEPGQQQGQRPQGRQDRSQQNGGRRQGGPESGATQPQQQREQPPQREQRPRPDRGPRPQGQQGPGPQRTEPQNLGQGRVFRRGGDAPADGAPGQAREPRPPREPREPRPANQDQSDGSPPPKLTGNADGQRAARRRNRRNRNGGGNSGGGAPPPASD